MRLIEWKVKCPWCEAEAGSPCVDNHGNQVPDGQVHNARIKEYDNKVRAWEGIK